MTERVFDTDFERLAEPDYAMHSTAQLLDLMDTIEAEEGLVPTDLTARLIERGVDLSAPRTTYISY